MIRPALIVWEDIISGHLPWYSRESMPAETGRCWSLGWVERLDDQNAWRVFSAVGQFGDSDDPTERYGAPWVIPAGAVRYITYLDTLADAIRWPALDANTEV